MKIKQLPAHVKIDVNGEPDDDNFREHYTYYVANYPDLIEQFTSAPGGDKGELRRMQFSDVVIDRRKNTLVKMRHSLTDVIDVYMHHISQIGLPLYITDLASTMNYKYVKNKHKPCETMMVDGERQFEHLPAEWLLKRAREELDELEEAITSGSAEEIRKEAADVANFMGFIHYNYREKEDVS